MSYHHLAYVHQKLYQDLKNTTHAMGIILCISPKSNLIGTFKIPLKQTTPGCVLKIADRSFLLKPESSLQLASWVQDTLSLYSTLFVKHPPNWQGFMSQVLFNPTVPFNPETHEAILPQWSL